MLSSLRIRNFKPWQDTGEITLRRITGLFGANSSGKSSILQLLRLVQSSVLFEKQRPLAIDEGQAAASLLHGEAASGVLSYALGWERSQPGSSMDDRVRFEADVRVTSGSMETVSMKYRLDPAHGDKITIGLQQREGRPSTYDLIADGFETRRQQLPGVHDLPRPTGPHAFPNQLFTLYDGTERYAALPISLEKVLRGVHYLGPLRDEPRSVYGWGGDEPHGVAARGQAVVAAIASASDKDSDFQSRIAEHLRSMGLVHSFRLHHLGRSSHNFQVLLKTAPRSPEVLLTDVGFGISQVLPVIVQAEFAKTGSTLIFDQPEAHLHPGAQSALADVLINAAKARDLQLIIESHSEHFLRRLQRRIAEDEDTVTSDDVALYFCAASDEGSVLTPLQLDPYGSISNWPDNFFGDEFGEIAAMSKASIRRKQLAG